MPKFRYAKPAPIKCRWETSGQRISTKAGIASTLLVHPRAGESILQPRAAAGACYLHSLIHFDGGTAPKIALCSGGSGPPPKMVPLAHLSPHPHGISIGSSLFEDLRLYPTETHWQRQTDRQTDHATSVAIGRIFATRVRGARCDLLISVKCYCY